jgi:NADPH2:quinone reductase
MAVLNSYGTAIDVLAAGAVDTERMVTHRLPLDRFAEGVELVRRGEGLKVRIAPAAP